MENWHHDELGEFQYNKDFEAFIGTIQLPAFDLFTLDIRNRAMRGYKEKGKGYEVILAACKQTRKPYDEHVRVIQILAHNQHRIVPKIVESLWNQFNGIGDRPGCIWWFGGLVEVNEDMEGDKLSNSQGIYCLMGLTEIDVFEHEGKPIIRLLFDAKFEEEHGVGILTDGHSILGSGYMMSPHFFGQV